MSATERNARSAPALNRFQAQVTMLSDEPNAAVAVGHSISPHDDAEDAGWFEKIGVTPRQLFEAVSAVGEAPDDVERYLAGQGER